LQKTADAGFFPCRFVFVDNAVFRGFIHGLLKCFHQLGKLFRPHRFSSFVGGRSRSNRTLNSAFNILKRVFSRIVSLVAFYFLTVSFF